MCHRTRHKPPEQRSSPGGVPVVDTGKRDEIIAPSDAHHRPLRDCQRDEHLAPSNRWWDVWSGDCIRSHVTTAAAEAHAEQRLRASSCERHGCGGPRWARLGYSAVHCRHALTARHHTYPNLVSRCWPDARAATTSRARGARGARRWFMGTLGCLGVPLEAPSAGRATCSSAPGGVPVKGPSGSLSWLVSRSSMSAMIQYWLALP